MILTCTDIFLSRSVYGKSEVHANFHRIVKLLSSVRISNQQKTDFFSVTGVYELIIP
jgi:hypothetical protein